jgi:cell division septal protein FtsQ
VPITAPADRRFLRAQVKPGRRHAPWRRWLQLARLLASVCLLLAVGGWLARVVVRADALKVAHLAVGGNQRLSSGEVLALLDGMRGRNILFVDLDEWRQKVLASPWVADVTMRRALPGTVHVRVIERRPIAIGRVGDEFFLIDEHGGVIDEYGPRYADFDLPILDGLTSGGGPEAAVNARRVDLASRLLQDVRTRPELAKRISQVDVSDPRNAVVIVDQDTARVKLGDERFAERLQLYMDLAPRLRERVPGFDYVDVRFGERVTVGAQQNAEAPALKVAAAARRSGTTNQ